VLRSHTRRLSTVRRRVLGFFLASCYAVTRTALPRLLAYVASLSTQSEELYQMMLVAFCLAVAWVSDYFGLSIELGPSLSARLAPPSGPLQRFVAIWTNRDSGGR
jgi:predicted Kef-type K+ transport protein